VKDAANRTKTISSSESYLLAGETVSSDKWFRARERDDRI
jgi:hypothetical protein